MATKYADADTDADANNESWQTQGHTTLVIKQNDDGEWLVTQRTVDLVGRGPSAAAAAAAYCRAIEAAEE